MGTVINEVGSTAGGTAKVEYKDEAGNVLWYYDDAGNFVRNGNAKITGLAGTGSRMVVADATGNLSASIVYESSTWNPVITGTTTNPTITYTTQYGKYTKIGNIVYYNIILQIATISGGSGGIRISLPYTAAAGNGGYNKSPVLLSGVTYTGMPIAGTAANAASCAISTIASGSTATAMSISSFSANSAIEITGFYFTA